MNLRAIAHTMLQSLKGLADVKSIDTALEP